MARDLTTEELANIDARTRGILEGLGMYAWWKDGVQYVGTTGTTLRQACSRVLREHGFTAEADALITPKP